MQGVESPLAYDLADAQFILSFGASLLESWIGPVHASQAYARLRRSVERPRGLLIQVDPRRSTTAIKADRWIPINPGTDGIPALGIANAMAQRGIAMSQLTTEEMSDIIGYLYFLQFVAPPGVAARGRMVFQEKRCGQCHAAPGSGAAVDLTRAEKLATPLEVVTEMWNHATAMEETMLKQFVEWPVFRGGEMADMVAYLLSLRKDQAPQKK